MKNKMSFLAYVAIIMLAASCTKAESIEPQIPSTKITKVLPVDTTIIGAWVPNDLCRQNLWEKFVITTDTFYWYQKGYINISDPSQGIGSVPTTFISLKAYDPKKPYSGLTGLFEIKGGKLFTYSNVDEYGDIMPSKHYPNKPFRFIPGSDAGFAISLASKDLLLFAGWSYTRK